MPDFSSIIQMLNLRFGVILSLTLACGVFVFGPAMGLAFTADAGEPIRQWAVIGLVLFGALTIVTIAIAAGQTLRSMVSAASDWFAKRQKKAKRLQSARASLDDLTDDEAAILAYLLTRGERHFISSMDGDRAASLIGRGLIHMAVRPGQNFDITATPFTVDDDVWLALNERKDEFEHENPNGPAPYRKSRW